jgi:hypothetical protein
MKLRSWLIRAWLVFALAWACFVAYRYAVSPMPPIKALAIFGLPIAGLALALLSLFLTRYAGMRMYRAWATGGRITKAAIATPPVLVGVLLLWAGHSALQPRPGYNPLDEAKDFGRRSLVLTGKIDKILAGKPTTEDLIALGETCVDLQSLFMQMAHTSIQMSTTSRERFRNKSQKYNDSLALLKLSEAAQASRIRACEGLFVSKK